MGGGIDLNVKDDMWRHYYQPTVDLIGSNPRTLAQMLREPVLMPVENLDLQIGVLRNASHL